LLTDALGLTLLAVVAAAQLVAKRRLADATTPYPASATPKSE
jgi:hypothetical protein